MANSNGGKTSVVAAILKQHKPFRVATITEITGMDRQLTYYHVNKLLEQGKLLREGQSYSVVDRDTLLDDLVDVVETPGMRKMEPAGLFSQDSVETLNALVQGMVYAKVLKLTDSINMAVHMNRIIDESVTELKVLKRYLNNAQPGKRLAIPYFVRDGVFRHLDLWDVMVGRYDFEPSITKKDWENEIGEAE